MARKKRQLLVLIELPLVFFYPSHDFFHFIIYSFNIFCSLCSNFKTISLSCIFVYIVKIASSRPEFFENLCNINRTKVKRLQTIYNHIFVVTLSIVKIAFIYIALNASNLITLTSIVLANFWQLKECKKGCNRY